MHTEETLHVLRVQVQVVTYNSADSIIKCLESVLSQEFPIHRVLVIDNASRDNTVELVRESFPSVTVVCNRKNTGYAGGHNVGFRLAQSDDLDYVVTLNPDARMESGYVKYLVECMEADGVLGGATGKLLRFDNDRSGNHFLDSTGLYVDYVYHAHDRGSGQVDCGQYDERGHVWGICGAAALYRVSMLEDLKKDARAFDETFFLYKEDVDLCWQAHRRGWSFWYSPDARCYHRRAWQPGAKVSDLALAYSYCNQVAVVIRHASGPNLRLVLTLCVELTRLSVLLLRRPKVAVRSLVLLQTSWRNHWYRRRQFEARDFTKEQSGYGIRYSGHL